uniref:Calcitonin peptide-like domain-containing protein n=1 Tax=Poecilia mexicana TaxID=48701 RepID=A0A3B3Y8V3_9TELE
MPFSLIQKIRIYVLIRLVRACEHEFLSCKNMSFFVFLTSRFICFSHRLQKRICNLSTCLTHNLGEMLMNNVRGTPKTPMNVGPKSFGKRDIQPPGFLPF